jgi:ankyrin repeat protein
MIEEIHKACHIGNTEVLKNLISSCPEYLNHSDARLGWSPLYRSVAFNQLESVKILLEYGADVNLQNRLGESPLHQAANNNFMEISKVLLENGASPNLGQNDGDTPLHHACAKGHVEMVKLLLKYYADPMKPNKVLCKTPIDYAIESNNTEIIQLLHQKKNKSYVSYSDDSVCISKETNFEPESEKTSRNMIPSQLLSWLTKNKLESVYEVLIQNGYDDLNMLVNQMKSNMPINQESLKRIGIKKPGHRIILLAKLEDETRKKPRMSNAKSMNRITWCVNAPLSPGIDFIITMEDFLDTLGLKQLYRNFIESGLEEYDQVLFLMNSNYPITDEFLQKEVGIEKIGYRHRILSRLNEEARFKKKNNLRIEREDVRSACECTLM